MIMADQDRFGSSTTGDEIVEAFANEVNGKTFLITGASAHSLGAETALSLARKGTPAQLILLSRTESRVTPVLSQIQHLNPRVQTFFFPIDLSSRSSVHAAAERVLAHPQIQRIDVLINNAGVMGVPYAPAGEFRERGGRPVEMHLAANHLGPFLLTALVLERMRQAGVGARVVNVSSAAYMGSGIRFEDLNFSNGKKYKRWEAYGQSKTANILMAKSLSMKVASREVASFSLHPGIIQTNLNRHFSGFSGPSESNDVAEGPFDRSPQQGCSTILFAALDPQLQAHSGAYLGDCQIQEAEDFATDERIAERLWILSKEIVGIKGAMPFERRRRPAL
ncbi:short-chain dehydrogenase [Eremomyces bilateralis CBS 781.70]|uniref:Short-chain dehydrogenase n=1 Tax=Eremomyces bilateralis CBS 781.70 TaxID=1392243 RepID=A0A6G1GCN9_9PEZI|nr:short-chain dehydrogenase [Eremomyces bilateralis CBS 781.70]KAF1815670.1 short-chain dehydrogenase [Eremomyces bilateralis CBS 781.70]